jgi:hypothetical protein
MWSLPGARNDLALALFDTLSELNTAPTYPMLYDSDIPRIRHC